jgi:membrane protein YdbS with pleckstrin-like domain
MDPTNNIPTQQPIEPPQSDGSDINPIVVLRPGERVISEVRRHPIGMVSKYIATIVFILAAIIIAVLIIPQLSTRFNKVEVATIVYGSLAVLIILSVMFLSVARSIYLKNRWIVTTTSITLVVQSGLFGKQVSQLPLDDLEDVTVIQKGLLQNMLNFGTLRAETAAERSKFLFPYCPDPNTYARQILVAREEFTDPRRYSSTNQQPTNPTPPESYNQQPPIQPTPNQT